MRAEPQPKPTAPEVMRDILNTEPEPWAARMFLWSFALFMVITGAALAATLLDALTLWA